MDGEKLNDIKSILKIDKDEMYHELDNLPENFSTNLDITVPPEYGNIKKIMIGGMGGSGICGDIIETLFSDKLKMPIAVVKDYYLPSFVDYTTLSIIISYSGNTEETLALMDQCIKRNSKIIALSNGGEMMMKAEKEGIPFIKVNDSLMPRTALGNLLNPLLHIFKTLFPKTVDESEIKETINQLQIFKSIYTLSSPTQENNAKKFALKIKDSEIFVLGSKKLTSASALRWKTQFNENSKINIYYNTFPELCHNEIIGLVDDPEKKGKNIVIFALRSTEESPLLKRSMDVALDIFREAGHEVINVCGKGESRLSCLITQCYLGDWISYYLAILRGVNPTPVDSIDMYKQKKKELVIQ
ncbi:MAG: bifunctional phosphoglucose/phosphomannose isomerase [Candidatus Schekmanbacteria bacterium]|nr:MAG: bifunctional phosphoglucose/phosphomannose isomerase [Candidatus Schekmanbacteria bacterium]